MKFTSIFDVIGNVMVGPSSSHTAGACKIAYVAYSIFGEVPKTAIIYPHGSFAETYKGHGSDKAIIGGLLGLKHDNLDIRESNKIAKEKGMTYSFKKKDLGMDVHPNSFLIKISNGIKDDGSKTLSLLGSSIGGGNIIIKQINDLEANFDGHSITLIIISQDKVGVLADMTKIFAELNYNIGKMHNTRDIKKGLALSWFEVDSPITDTLVDELLKIDGILEVKYLNV